VTQKCCVSFECDQCIISRVLGACGIVLLRLISSVGRVQMVVTYKCDDTKMLLRRFRGTR